jgi:hypothetical protein
VQKLQRNATFDAATVNAEDARVNGNQLFSGDELDLSQAKQTGWKFKVVWHAKRPLSESGNAYITDGVTTDQLMFPGISEAEKTRLCCFQKIWLQRKSHHLFPADLQGWFTTFQGFEEERELLFDVHLEQATITRAIQDRTVNCLKALCCIESFKQRLWREHCLRSALKLSSHLPDVQCMPAG